MVPRPRFQSFRRGQCRVANTEGTIGRTNQGVAARAVNNGSTSFNGQVVEVGLAVGFPAVSDNPVEAMIAKR